MKVLFPTPYTPQSIYTMNVPFGAPVGKYNLNLGMGSSGVSWSESAQDAATVASRISKLSGGYAGPLLSVQGTPGIRSGSWRFRHQKDTRHFGY